MPRSKRSSRKPRGCIARLKAYLETPEGRAAWGRSCESPPIGSPFGFFYDVDMYKPVRWGSGKPAPHTDGNG